MKLNIERSYEYRKSRLASVCGFLITLCAAQAGLGQQSAPLKPVATTIATAVPPAATQDDGAEAKRPSASSTAGDIGIKVHGHWKFVVHRRTGRLLRKYADRRQQFDYRRL